MSEWASGNRWLGQSEMENNARIIDQILTSKGWSKNAIAALLGNMQVESSINPGIWEDLCQDPERFFEDYGRYPGLGLVQWTPYTKLLDWTGGSTSGDAELERLQYEVDNELQWFRNPQAPIPDPPMSFREWTQSTDTPGHLAYYFMWYYEHPADLDQPQRKEYAEFWFRFIGGDFLLLFGHRKKHYRKRGVNL